MRGRFKYNEHYPIVEVEGNKYIHTRQLLESDSIPEHLFVCEIEEEFPSTIIGTQPISQMDGFSGTFTGDYFTLAEYLEEQSAIS